jgi:hypothetical protein
MFNFFGVFFIDFLFVSFFYTWFIENYASLFFQFIFYVIILISQLMLQVCHANMGYIRSLFFVSVLDFIYLFL